MRYFVLAVLMAFSVRAEWFRSPVAFKQVDGTLELVGDGSGFAVRDELPFSKEVSVEGVFTIRESGPSDNWRVGAVAVIENQRNFWHLGVVRAPKGQSFNFGFELAEMLDGKWLSQSSLKVEFAENTPGVQLVSGSRWHLKIEMDEKGITGAVKDMSGKTVFRQRYAFNGRAVTYGRPALHSTGLSGVFSDLKFTSGEPLELADETQSFPPYQSDNFVKEVTAPATGFFYVKQFDDGRWWAIDPLGRGVVVLGVDHTTFWGHWCEKLGYAPYRRKNEKKYPDPSVWEEETLDRLKGWGFTMLGAGSQESLRRRGLFHCVNLGIGTQLSTMGEEYYITPNEKRPCSSFPNVFHPEFEMYCRYVALTKCRPNLNDPWMFGYFSDNELAWWGRGQQQTGLFDAAMKFDASHTAKQALVNLVKQKAGGGIEQFNAVWNTKCGSFDDVIKLKQLPSASEAQIQIKHDFLRLVAERYFSVTTRIIREVDPSHMVLGARFAGTGGADPAVWEITGKYCDVVTFNCYPKADLDEGIVYSGFGVDAEPVTEHFAKYYEYVKKPMLITEWSFPALDAGVPSVHGAGQRFFTQTGRTAATKLFAQTMLSLPYLIGYDYFMWVDEPALGISTPFPEDSNYGLVNEDNVPYPQITGMFAELHGDLWNQRTSPVPPVRTAVKKRVLSPMESVLKLKEDTTGEVQVSADEKRYVIENGRLKLEGRIGGRIFENVSLDGVLFGSYTAMLHILDVKGENQWREIQRVTAFSSRMERGCAVLDVTGEHKGVPDFETTHRILIAPGSTKFICELVCIKNTGTGKLPVKAAYFRFNGADKEWDVSSFPPNLWGVPESSCWMHPEKGAYYGALASRRSPGIRIHFWKDPNHNSFHPDARFEMDRILEPGALFRPDEPVFVVGLCGTGGRAAWLEDLKNGGALLETIQ